MTKNYKSNFENKEIYDIALKTLSLIDNEIAISFSQDLPDAISLEEKSIDPKVLPITDVLASITRNTTLTSELINVIKSTAHQQSWRQPYDVDDFGLDFYQNTGWFPIVDIEGPLVYTKGLVEIMLLNADTKYPKHRHFPEELYLVLNGRVWWESEQEDSFCWKEAGEVIHHPSNCIHSIRSGEEPVLILAVWRGGSFEKPIIE